MSDVQRIPDANYQPGCFGFPAVPPLDEQRALERGGVIPASKETIREKFGFITTDPVAGTRRCFKCGVVKPLTDFHRERAESYGHHYKCKTCVLDYQRERRAKQKGDA